MNLLNRRWRLVLVALIAAIAVAATACEPAESTYWQDPPSEPADTGTVNNAAVEEVAVNEPVPELAKVTQAEYDQATQEGTPPACKPEEGGPDCEGVSAQFTWWTSFWVYNCPFLSVTCTVYFTIRGTRYISRNGMWATLAGGLIGNKVIATIAAAAIIAANQQADKALAAAPDRCLIIKHTKASYASIVSVGTVHHTNHYCRSGY